MGHFSFRILCLSAHPDSLSVLHLWKEDSSERRMEQGEHYVEFLRKYHLAQR